MTRGGQDTSPQCKGDLVQALPIRAYLEQTVVPRSIRTIEGLLVEQHRKIDEQ
jgi:hypothetical protein